jgi:hypothetical protein
MRLVRRGQKNAAPPSENSGSFVGSDFFVMDIERLNSTPFYSAHIRIERAKEHLKDLESQIAQFFAEKPYALAVEDDPDGLHKIHKLQFTKRFPFRWRILATEIIEHARASLDHAAFGAHLVARGDPNANEAPPQTDEVYQLARVV